MESDIQHGPSCSNIFYFISRGVSDILHGPSGSNIFKLTSRRGELHAAWTPMFRFVLANKQRG